MSECVCVSVLAFELSHESWQIFNVVAAFLHS